jgi:hypothetical protein
MKTSFHGPKAKGPFFHRFFALRRKEKRFRELEQLQSYRKLGKNPQGLKPGNLLQRNRRHECLLHPVMAHIHAENALGGMMSAKIINLKTIHSSPRMAPRLQSVL